MIFQEYAQYYNLINKDKDYQAESRYIEKLIRKHSLNSETVLDLGCGTGIHDELLAASGFKVTGVDLSPGMIEMARNKKSDNCTYFLGDATKVMLDQKFDAVISLFHVLSYQLTNTDFKNLFDTAKNHLNPGGVFIFDFWYTPAVHHLKPAVKIRRVENDEYEILRISEPESHSESNVIDVNFEFHILKKLSDKYCKFRELHKMRHFSMPEIDYVLKDCSLRAIGYEEWMSGKKPCENTWGVCCISVLDK